MAAWIPRKDWDALAMMRQFADGIAADPYRYQLYPADGATLVGAVDAFGLGLSVATNDATRTKVTINQKRVLRAAAESVVRQYGALIKKNAGISDSDKIAIGVPPVNDEHSDIECPQSSPSLLVIASTPGAQTLQYRDSINPENRGKPFGATCLQLYVKVGEENAATPEGATFLGNFTANPVGVVFEFEERGKQATYFARWGGKRNQHGQWSAPVSLTIAA